MKVPLSWLKDFVDIELSPEKLAHRLTLAGLEVEEVHYIGLPLPEGKLEGRSGGHQRQETKISGLAWERDKIVVGAILEVMPHPNADRLVLCRLDDSRQVHTVLTGAPNLFPYRGAGPLSRPLKVAYALEGARIYDGHQPGQVPMVLKRAWIRGVESYSMACSEKELGISDDHEGIIILDDDAPLGMPLVDYMGDVVFDIAITPNIARDANILGVAREVAALTGKKLKAPSFEFSAEGSPMDGLVSIEILNPELNPRFVLGLIRQVKLVPSPYWVQRRLRLAGMRPINNIVDATNYAMLEVGEPLHAFDYDVLLQRAGGSAPKIITRTAHPGEKLTTLDNVERSLDAFTVLVCDTAGALSIAGVMGGAESEVNEHTQNVLLEGAAWNFINIRKTVNAQNLPSEASYRFSRGVHPAMASRGVSRGLEWMRRWSGGVICRGLVDSYPLPPNDPSIEITPVDVRRWLGIDMDAMEIVRILEALEFTCTVESTASADASQTVIRAKTPDHRLDIGSGVTGKADLLEEIARIYGYERIPETRLRDEIPPPRLDPYLAREEQLRDLLVSLGLQELVSYRMTSPEREARRFPTGHSPNQQAYVTLANPIASDRVVMRKNLLSSLLEVVERNSRLRERIALFEIGPIFIPSDAGDLPDELQRLVIILSGGRALPGWQPADTGSMDFFDLKGVLESMLEGLHVRGAHFESTQHPTYHPGKCARLNAGERELGIFGEVHPLVRQNYELSDHPLLAAELDLTAILDCMPGRFEIQTVPAFPPVLEDLALIVDEALPAEQVAEAIRASGGSIVSDVHLFDVYRGAQIGAGKKSLAYSLTYLAEDKTLSDNDVARVRQRIIRSLEAELGAKLRS